MGTQSKYCTDCKYNKVGLCWHPYAGECDHASLWTPAWVPEWITRWEDEDLNNEDN